MPDPIPTVGELFKAKAVTDKHVNAAVGAMLAGKLDDRAELAEGYVLDGTAGVKASALASSVLADHSVEPGARWNVARTAILLATAEKA